MSVELEHVMLSALPRSADLVITLRRDGAGLRLHVDLVTRAADRSGMQVAEARHTLTEKTGPERQILDELSRFVTANLADAMMRGT
jgi:hypothetical protein